MHNNAARVADAIPVKIRSFLYLIVDAYGVICLYQMLWKRKLKQKSSLHKKFIRLVKFDIFLMIFLPQTSSVAFRN
jgi:hypothetical protein